MAVASATELTPENWDSATAGKTVFIKFHATWCGHCKKMKPAWDALMAKYENDDKILVGDVDCTAAGKPLCDSNGVQGFPTIKHGDPANLEAYEGGRDQAALEKFASGLKPVCSPSNMDLCDEEGRKAIEAVQALSDADLDSQIAAADKKAADAESHFKTELDKLQAAYKKLSEEKDATLAEVKASGVGMLKSVRAARKASAKTEL